jgi:hypothetical protein
VFVSIVDATARLSQRDLYDERYALGAYDARSGVRVLTAEADSLRLAVQRAASNNPDATEMSVVDFGYGSGRVVNEFIDDYPRLPCAKPLRVIAYDVASAGLMKASDLLTRSGFEAGPLEWDPSASEGYIVGSLRRRSRGVELTVVLVHGSENDSPDEVRALLLKANGGERALVTCSWYSALGHISGERRRRDFFMALDGATLRSGELVVSVSSTGDLVEDQEVWGQRLSAGTIGDAPVEVPGDVLYKTELGQTNYFHVFGTDLGEHMAAITEPGQRWWVEGIRFPDEEFATREEEQANYRRVVAFNRRKAGRPWTAADYRRLHTVAAFRSRSGG